MVFISVDSQSMDLGNNDTSNDFDYDNNRDDYEASLLDQGLPDDEPWIDPIQRQIPSQEEEEMANAGTRDRLTAPRSEVRPRRAKSNQRTVLNDSQLIDELRQKQLTLLDEQIYLQKILQENALIAQEEAQERLMHIQIQRKIAEIELKQKEESMKK